MYKRQVDIHAPIKVYVNDIDKEGNPVKKMVETSVGRLMVNEFVPEEVGYINEVLGKKALRDIIGKVITACGVAPVSYTHLDVYKRQHRP